VASTTLEVQADREIDAITKAIDAHTSLVVKKITLDIHSNLIDKPANGGTPIDTGYARSNWIPRIGKPFEGTVGQRPVVDYNARAIGMEGTIGSIDNSTQQAGREEVASGYRIALGPATITNNVEYIGALNNGSSKQAPKGFIERAIIKAVKEDIRR
jgi:hypothetical protein